MPLQDLHVTQRLVTVRLTRGEHLVKTAEKEKCHYDLVALDPASEAFNCLYLFCEFPGWRILLLFPNRYGPFKAACYMGKSYANPRKR